MSNDLINQILHIPALGRKNFNLGNLYDARTDEIVPTEFTLWSQSDLKTSDVTHNNHTHCTVITSDKLSEKLKKLKLGGSLQLGIISGLLDLKRSANFLNKTPQTQPELIVRVLCHHRTLVKSLTTEQLSKAKVRYADFSTRAAFCDSATHVITEIQYGSESTFTFRKSCHSTQNKHIVETDLAECASDVVKSILDQTSSNSPYYYGGDSIYVSFTRYLCKCFFNATFVDCHFEGDFKLPSVVPSPTTFSETWEFAKKFKNILHMSMIRTDRNEPLGVPCVITLYPLVNLSRADRIPRLRQEISNTLASGFVRLMEDYEEMEGEIEDLLKHSLVAKLSPLFEKLQVFQQLFDAFRADLKTKLRNMLINIRSGRDDVASLGQLLKRFNNKLFTFNPHRLGLWLKEKHEELCMVSRFLDQYTAQNLHRGRIYIFPSNKVLREQMSTCSVRETFHFVFTALANPETLLANMENSTFDTDPMTDVTETPRWYRDQQVIERMEQETLNFTAFIKFNMEDKSLAFALTALDVNDESHETPTTGSSIFAYRRGILTQKNALKILTSRIKMKVFADRIAEILKTTVKKAFIQEMIEKTSSEIKNEKWLHDARFMHKYMDLQIANMLNQPALWLFQSKIQRILYWISRPKEFYNRVLEKLIAGSVKNVDKSWNDFTIALKRAIQKAAIATDPSVDMNITRAQKFVNQLRIEFSKSGFSNESVLDSAFQIDCNGEHDDFNSEEDATFKEIWSRELINVLDKQCIPFNLDLEYYGTIDYTIFSRKVIEYIKSSPFTKFGESARPRCDACCPICKALCIEAANHDTRTTPHNAIHQPAGIVGAGYRSDNSLIHKTCSQRYSLDDSFYLNLESNELYSFEKFARVFPGWKNPLIKEDLPLREYVFATYNKEIAKLHHMEPCGEIPQNYFRDLWAIRKQLEMDTQILSIKNIYMLDMF